MSSDVKKQLLVTAVSGVVAGAAVAAGPAAAGLAATIPGLLDLAISVLQKRNRSRAEGWLTELMKDDDFARLCAPVADGSSALAVRLESDFYFSELFHRALREVVNAVSSDAVGPLARLMRSYIASGAKEPDEFFRAAASTFASFDGAQLSLLKEVTAAIAARKEAVPQLTIRDGLMSFKDETTPLGERAQPAIQTPLRRVFHRLKTEGLGFDNGGGFFDTVSGPDVLLMEREVAQRVLSLLEP